MLSCRHTPVGLGPSARAGVQAAAWGTGKVPPRPLCRVARGCVSVRPICVAPRQRVRPSASCAGLRGQNPSRTDRHKQHHRCRHTRKGWEQTGGKSSLREKRTEKGQWARGREGGGQSARQPDAVRPCILHPPTSWSQGLGRSQWGSASFDHQAPPLLYWGVGEP